MTNFYQFSIFSPKIKWGQNHGSQLHIIYADNLVCVVTGVKMWSSQIQVRVIFTRDWSQVKSFS